MRVHVREELRHGALRDYRGNPVAPNSVGRLHTVDSDFESDITIAENFESVHIGTDALLMLADRAFCKVTTFRSDHYTE